MTSITDIIRELGIEFNVYADDRHLYLAFQPIDQDSADAVLNKIQICMVEVKQWMVKYMLKLNDDKTTFIVIGTRKQRSKIDIPQININAIDIAPTSTVCNLGVMFDSKMSMKAHVSSINRSDYPQLKNVRAIKPFLDMEAANRAAHAFVSFCLDARNSILYGIALGQLQCIQRTQNTASRIITNTRRYDHITPVLHQLHWLPIQERIEFKVLCLTYKTLHNMAPLYLTQFLSQKIVHRQLRCKDQHMLQVPPTSQHPCCIMPCLSP